MTRRDALVGMLGIAAGASWSTSIPATDRRPEEPDSRPALDGSRLRKIATEEASEVPGAASRDALALTLLPRLLDLDAGRLCDMDANDVDVHVLSLGSPGVQMFDRDTAVALARLSNDRLSEAVGRHPKRFAGLAGFAPQDPQAAAREMERAIDTLKLNGFLVNSHTEGVYLDEPRCWPILEAAEALGAPLYIHPRAPSESMAAPFRDYRMEGAIWGYGVEVGTHAVRLMLVACSTVSRAFESLSVTWAKRYRSGCGASITWRHRARAPLSRIRSSPANTFGEANHAGGAFS
jgi:predicted TIM-barrel fold metal-dependent hydrolase